MLTVFFLFLEVSKRGFRHCTTKVSGMDMSWKVGGQVGGVTASSFSRIM